MMHILPFYYQLLHTMIVSMFLVKGARQIYAHELTYGDDDLYDASNEMDPLISTHQLIPYQLCTQVHK
jgi:hypothetical protein